MLGPLARGELFIGAPFLLEKRLLAAVEILVRWELLSAGILAAVLAYDLIEGVCLHLLE